MSNELTICITGRPGEGWGYTCHLGGRRVSLRETGAYSSAGLALKHALEDVQTVAATAKAKREGGSGA